MDLTVLKRHSTDSQDATQQTVTIERYLKANNLVPNFTIEESAHGDAPFMDRELGRVLREAQSGDRIIVSEFTRLSRDLDDSFLLLKVLKDTQVSIYAIKEDLEIDGSNMDIIIYMRVLMSAHSSSDELSKIRTRTLECMVALKFKLDTDGFFISKRSGRIIEKMGNTTNLAKAQKLANKASVIKRMENALKNTKLKQAWMTANLLQQSGLKNKQIVNTLNSSGYKTLSGGDFSTKNISRFIRTYSNIYDGEIPN